VNADPPRGSSIFLVAGLNGWPRGILRVVHDDQRPQTLAVVHSGHSNLLFRTVVTRETTIRG
jgi:hypothetical protein